MTIFTTEIWGRRGADLLGSNLRPHLCVIGGLKLSLEGPLRPHILWMELK